MREKPRTKVILPKWMDREDWLTFKDAMRVLGVSRATLYRWTASGRVPHRWVESQLRYVPKELHAFMRKVRTE